MNINKRVGLSFLTIAGVLTAVVGITFAQISSSVTLTDNTLSAGSANLQIADFGGDCSTASYGASTTGVSSTNLGPGQSGTKDFCLKNTSDGTIALAVSAAVINTDGTLDQSKVNLSIECGAGAVVGTEASYPGTVIVNLAQGTTVKCSLTQTLDTSASNSDSGHFTKYNVVFTGTSP